jgi:hypothetical protein
MRARLRRSFANADSRIPAKGKEKLETNALGCV